MIVTSLGGARIESSLGKAELAALDPGATRFVAADEGEQAVVVLDGAATVLGREVRTDSVVLIGAGKSVTVHALRGAVTLLVVRAAVSTPVGAGTPTRIVDAHDVDEIAVHDPERGFCRMTARLLVSGPSAGHRAFTVGMSTFAPGEGCHALHRHAHAEELFLVRDGEGTHLSADRAEHPLHSGDLTWVGKSEFHGFRNAGARVARAVFCYLGVDDRISAGYEVSPDIHP